MVEIGRFMLFFNFGHNCTPGRKSGVYGISDRYASASARPRPPRPETLSCVHSTGHKFEPIVFIFGMGVDCGKISTPIVFGRVPRSKMAAGGHFGKKIKTSDFRSKTRFRQFPAKKIFFFFFPHLKNFSGLDLENFRNFFFFFFFPPPPIFVPKRVSGNFQQNFFSFFFPTLKIFRVWT